MNTKPRHCVAVEWQLHVPAACKPGNRFYVIRKTGGFVDVIYRQVLETFNKS